jgi:hypothetical protein
MRDQMRVPHGRPMNDGLSVAPLRWGRFFETRCGNNEPLKRADFRCWQIVLQSRKLNAPENSAKVDFLSSLKLQNSVAPIGRSVVAFV